MKRQELGDGVHLQGRTVRLLMTWALARGHCDGSGYRHLIFESKSSPVSEFRSTGLDAFDWREWKSWTALSVDAAGLSKQ